MTTPVKVYSSAYELLVEMAPHHIGAVAKIVIDHYVGLSQHPAIDDLTGALDLDLEDAAEDYLAELITPLGYGVLEGRGAGEVYFQRIAMPRGTGYIAMTEVKR